MKPNKFFDSLSIKAGILAILSLSGCIATTFPYMRAETAQRIASPAWMIKRDIPSTPYQLRAYERIHDKGSFANVYIEGDGAAYTSPKEWNDNPTPKNPVALHLASRDLSDNVIYLARPCQYTTGTDAGSNCTPAIWKESRYAQEAIASFNTALDEMASRYRISGFNLIGYSGGGGIAAILAAQRTDILSIRTVAGILDHEVHTTMHGAEPLSDSLNPVDFAIELTKVPQYHFIAGQDNIVPPAILHSFLQAMPPTQCTQTKFVQEAGYEEGWVEQWPALLALPVTCRHGKSKTEMMRPALGHKHPHAPATMMGVKQKPAKP